MNRNKFLLTVRQMLMAVSILTLTAACGGSGDEPIVPDDNSGDTTETPVDPDPDDGNKDDNTRPTNILPVPAVVYPAQAMLESSTKVTTALRTIYVDAYRGDDSNSGLSEATPIKTLAKLADMNINFGDHILLKGGRKYNGTIELLNINDKDSRATQRGDTQVAQILISSYGGGQAEIDCAGYPAGILIENTSHVRVTNISITGDGGGMVRTADQSWNYRSTHTIRTGIYIITSKKGTGWMQDIQLDNITIHDIYFKNPVTESQASLSWDQGEGDVNKGWGIRVKTNLGGKSPGLADLNFYKVTIKDVAHTGMKVMGNGGSRQPDGKPNHIENVNIQQCELIDIGGPGFQPNRINNGHVWYNKVLHSGNNSDLRKWGRGSGLWTWTCDTFIIEHNEFIGARGIGDSCGCHIDFNCSNIIVQYNFSADNSGGFVEILGNNHNCCYRYNVSVNDAFRDPKNDLQDRALAYGATFVINGFVGSGKTPIGAKNSYVYNNTIIVTHDSYPCGVGIANSVEGVFMANNLFWIQQEMHKEWGEVFRNPNKDTQTIEMFNNFYRVTKDVLPEVYRPLETAPIEGGDPWFNDMTAVSNNTGTSTGMPLNATSYDVYGKPSDFIPRNLELINQGVAITKLPTDQTDKGLYVGLGVDKDFFGNPITTPIIGAIVPQK